MDRLMAESNPQQRHHCDTALKPLREAYVADQIRQITRKCKP